MQSFTPPVALWRSQESMGCVLDPKESLLQTIKEKLDQLCYGDHTFFLKLSQLLLRFFSQFQPRVCAYGEKTAQSPSRKIVEISSKALEQEEDAARDDGVYQHLYDLIRKVRKCRALAQLWHVTTSEQQRLVALLEEEGFDRVESFMLFLLSGYSFQSRHTCLLEFPLAEHVELFDFSPFALQALKSCSAQDVPTCAAFLRSQELPCVLVQDLYTRCEPKLIAQLWRILSYVCSSKGTFQKETFQKGTFPNESKTAFAGTKDRDEERQESLILEEEPLFLRRMAPFALARCHPERVVDLMEEVIADCFQESTQQRSQSTSYLEQEQNLARQALAKCHGKDVEKLSKLFPLSWRIGLNFDVGLLNGQAALLLKSDADSSSISPSRINSSVSSKSTHPSLHRRDH